MDYQKYFAKTLESIKAEGRYRVFASLERLQGHFPTALFHGPQGIKEVTVWCSNDYLGMGQHPTVLNAMKQAIDSYGAGAGGTRNISGTNKIHTELEDELASLHFQEAALVFTSGYVANEAALGTLTSKIPNICVFSDEQNHASMIHGIRSGRAEKKIFRHNDMGHLKSLLQEHPFERPKLIAVESVYSMEGDIAPLEELINLSKNYNALLYVDEVHAVGLYGSHGGGMSEQLGLAQHIDIIQGTLGKAYGVVGGYVAGSKVLVDFIRSFAPGFIFTTALPPALVTGALAAVKHLKVSSEERLGLHRQVKSLKETLTAYEIPFYPTPSHIVPVIIGDAALCKAVTDELLFEHSIYVQPINYPTVPKGTERLRLVPTPFHDNQKIIELACSLKTVLQKFNVFHSQAA